MRSSEDKNLLTAAIVIVSMLVGVIVLSITRAPFVAIVLGAGYIIEVNRRNMHE